MNFVIDGNSIYRGNEPGSLASALSAYTSSGDNVWSVGIGSQNWNAIANNHQDVDLSYRSGYQNILIVGEGNNHFYKTGYSVQSALDAVRQYITDVKAIHPEWQIILAGNLPAWEPGLSVSEHEIYNAQMREWNALAATQYSSLGADAFVDYRSPGSIFESDDRAILDQHATYWADRYVHPNAKGKTEMAKILAAGIGEDISVSKTYEITFKFDADPGLLSVWDGVTGNLKVQRGELSNITGTGLIRTALFRPDFSTVLNKEFGSITYSTAIGDQILSIDVMNPELVTASRNKRTYAIGDSFQLSITFNEDMVITQGAKIKLDLSGREVAADFDHYNSATKSAVFNCLVDSLDFLNSTSLIVSASNIYDNYQNPWLFKPFSISSTFIDASVF